MINSGKAGSWEICLSGYIKIMVRKEEEEEGERRCHPSSLFLEG